jgi:hypothetical protein
MRLVCSSAFRRLGFDEGDFGLFQECSATNHYREARDLRKPSVCHGLYYNGLNKHHPFSFCILLLIQVFFLSEIFHKSPPSRSHLTAVVYRIRPIQTKGTVLWSHLRLVISFLKRPRNKRRLKPMPSGVGVVKMASASLSW